MDIEKEKPTQQIEKNTPVGRRWVVVSVAHIAIWVLKEHGIVDPKEREIKDVVILAKRSSDAWDTMQTRAHKLRLIEMTNLTGPLDEEAKLDGKRIKKALCQLHVKYERINEDSKENFSYLDEIIFDNHVGESKKDIGK